MILFHGSNVEVKTPIICPNQRALDFGAGFYLTSNAVQARKWAKIVTRRRRTGISIVSSYQFDEEDLRLLSVLHFEMANIQWLEFVVHNRKELPKENIYDIVIGPVANDSTLPVINDYMDGVYTNEEAVKRLLPQNLTDQYAFLNNRAIELLKFKESEEL
jgi:hypothetical protein